MSGRIVSALKKDGVVLSLFTNNLAAYFQLMNTVPKDEHHKLSSYPTLNRQVRLPGNQLDYHTTFGCYQIQKLQVHKKVL